MSVVILNLVITKAAVTTRDQTATSACVREATMGLTAPRTGFQVRAFLIGPSCQNYNWSAWTTYGCHNWSPLSLLSPGRPGLGLGLGLGLGAIVISACESHTDVFLLRDHLWHDRYSCMSEGFSWCGSKYSLLTSPIIMNVT